MTFYNGADTWEGVLGYEGVFVLEVFTDFFDTYRVFKLLPNYP
jgi:hypothetical protein